MTSLAESVAPDPRLDRLAADASALGFDIVDIAGFLDLVDALSLTQLAHLKEMRAAFGCVQRSNARVHEVVEGAAQTTQATLDTVVASVEQMQSATTSTREVAGWVSGLGARMQSVDDSLRGVQSNTQDITSIASQVNILAINAKIEAAQAGDSGRGFAVVAEAINELSRKTAGAAEGITASIAQLNSWVATLSGEAAEVSQSAAGLIAQTEEADTALSEIAGGARAAHGANEKIANAAAEVKAASGALAPALERIGKSVEETASGIHQARDRSVRLIDRSERMVQGSVAAGGRSADGRFIDRVQNDARQIGAALEAEIAAGRITTAALFSQDYQPIRGTDPAQVRTSFTDLTDRLLPPFQEAALKFDPKIVFCAAVDRNGYLPTHNKKFSHPQGSDPVWNASHCRNRRIFDDRVGLKAGQSTEPFLLQVYRRDMGGGAFLMMKDLSAPITVGGRHWGGLRLAYTS
ncbi:MAG: chemotaxis protein [Alphaproteobacteria bacterium]|nr:chemotaxis protein [Alphaproteobacteria bacterium]NNF25579.1 chemotaxis protein [Paracoccaceae bacterium]